MIETIIILAVAYFIGCWCFHAGKRIGSQKGFGVGRYRGRY